MCVESIFNWKVHFWLEAAEFKQSQNLTFQFFFRISSLSFFFFWIGLICKQYFKAHQVFACWNTRQYSRDKLNLICAWLHLKPPLQNLLHPLFFFCPTSYGRLTLTVPNYVCVQVDTQMRFSSSPAEGGKRLTFSLRIRRVRVMRTCIKMGFSNVGDASRGTAEAEIENMNIHSICVFKETRWDEENQPNNRTFSWETHKTQIIIQSGEYVYILKCLEGIFKKFISSISLQSQCRWCSGLSKRPRCQQLSS